MRIARSKMATYQIASHLYLGVTHTYMNASSNNNNVFGIKLQVLLYIKLHLHG